MARKKSKAQQVGEAVEAALGSETICERCGATVATFSQQCSADLLDQCPGFLRIEEVRAPIAKRVYGL